MASFLNSLRPLLHPILVHFPIALLFASVALDLVGYIFRITNLTRAGFYVLALGVAGAGVAAIVGPDHATGSATADALLIAHQNLALLTVALGVFKSQTPQTGPDWSGLMAATLVAALPMLILFMFFAKRIVNSIGFSGIK